MKELLFLAVINARLLAWEVLESQMGRPGKIVA